jgi:chromosome segregation ATPase
MQPFTAYKDLEKRIKGLEQEAQSLIKRLKVHRARVKHLEAKEESLEYANTALKVLLTQKDEETKKVEEKVLSEY